VAALSRTPGVVGVVVGTALYEGKTTLRDLIASVQATHSGMRKA
jgi:phosphoribosylformimino-5-aminoimidazole carboxamide ribonucleotide (ProFAR) isomerase